MSEDFEPAVGVAVVVFDGMKIVLGKRIGRYGTGFWQLPGGKPEPGESIDATAIRELEEETGLRGEGVVELARQLNDFAVVRKRFTTHFVAVERWSGTLENREPEKCEGWEWFDLDALPEPLFMIDPETIAAFKRFASMRVRPPSTSAIRSARSPRSRRR